MQQEQVAVYDLFPIIKITWRLPYKSFRYRQISCQAPAYFNVSMSQHLADGFNGHTLCQRGGRGERVPGKMEQNPQSSRWQTSDNKTQPV